MTRAPGVEVLVIVREARTGKVISGSEEGSGVSEGARSVVSGGLSRSEIENVNLSLRNAETINHPFRNGRKEWG